jgi:hypothetical protein
MPNTDNILNSINGLKRAEAPDHFYAGIRAKMQRQMPEEKPRAFILRPAFITSVLFVFLLGNIAVLSFNRTTEKTTIQTTTGAQAFAQEYNLSVQTLGQ